MNYPDFTNAIIRAIELGMIPEIRPDLTEQEIDDKIGEVYAQGAVSSEILAEQQRIMPLLNALDEKGVLDAFYPAGFAVRRIKIFKPKKRTTINTKNVG